MRTVLRVLPAKRRASSAPPPGKKKLWDFSPPPELRCLCAPRTTPVASSAAAANPRPVGLSASIVSPLADNDGAWILALLVASPCVGGMKILAVAPLDTVATPLVTAAAPVFL